MTDSNTNASLAPMDVMNNINSDIDKMQKRNVRILEESERAESERDLLQKKVYENANPSPLLIATICLATLLTMWILYTIFLKPDASGEWRDESNNKYHMSHNRFTGTIKMKINGKCSGYAKVIDNYFRYGDLVGLWDYSTSIVFVNGMQLYKLR